LARRFDQAFRALGITNHQFSLMMSLNRPQPAGMASVAALLGLDRTTLTAALKPLERRGLISLARHPNDKRARLLTLTPRGEALLIDAIPIWKATHAEFDRVLAKDEAKDLRSTLRRLG
jgi:DNA-binding MarR family transcriptional regulator